MPHPLLASLSYTLALLSTRPRTQLVTCAPARSCHSGYKSTIMITLEEKIARTERLLRRLEEDQPYLRARLSALGAEHRESANAFADRMRAEAEAELARLLAEREIAQV